MRWLYLLLLVAGCTERTPWVRICESDCDFAQRCFDANDRCYASCTGREELFSANYAAAKEVCNAELPCDSDQLYRCIDERIEITPAAQEYCRAYALALFYCGYETDVPTCETFYSSFDDSFLVELQRFLEPATCEGL
jgi:hypothetical protein